MRNLMILLAILVIMPIFSCSSSREVSERRSLMMPKTSDVPRNRGKYKEIDYSRRDKYQSKKYKERRSMSYSRR